MTEASRPPPSAEGLLEKTSLGQIIAYALDRKLNGTLELGPMERPLATVIVRDGWLSKARTNEPHYLGMLLHTMGLFDDTTHNASLARLAKERRPHGQILREMGAISEDDLLRGLRVQLAGKIEPLFALGSTTAYRYYEGSDALASWGGPEIVLADPLPIIWAGIQRSPPWEHVDAMLGRLEPGGALRIALAAEVERFRFAAPAQELVDILRQHALTIDDMIAAGVLERNDVRLLLFGLLLTKQLVSASTESTKSMPPPRSSSAPNAPLSPPRMPSFGPPRMPSGAPPPRMPSFGPPRMPSVAPSAPPVVEVRGSAPPARTSVPPPGVFLTPELAAFRQRIIERVATIASEDYFQVLGVTPEDTVEAAQHAYVMLAKIWHPDRLAPQLFDVSALSEKVFMRMTDARTTLTDPEKRAAYIAELSAGQRPDRGEPVGTTNAFFEFQKAEVFLKKRDLALAWEHCQRAHEADPANADYLALLTWIAIEKEGPGLDGLAKYMEPLGRALKMKERCERAYYYRGILYKRLNKPDKAYADFKMAAEINPKNIEAAREVHLFQKRSNST